MQSGYRGPGTRPISTAIGYNQLLTTNSVELFAEQGDAILKALQEKAAALSGAARKAMDSKIAVTKKMVAFAQSVPDTWSEHEKLADTEKGWALHAMVLDIDVGPHLQTHKLLTSVIFARAKGYTRPLSAAELEMMNLTGDGTGLDMKNRQLNATLQSAGLGVASLKDLSTSSDITVVSVPKETVDKIGPPFIAATIPANTYTGQDKDVPTAAVVNYLVTSSAVSDDLAYQMTKLVYESLPELQNAHAAGKEIKLETAATGSPVPLHPGAIRYYKEKGLIK